MTAVDVNANEIQAITTSTVDVNEVQIISTSASPIGEIQSITLSPPPGQNALDPSWTFSLSLDTTFSGGSLQYSGQMSATANATEGRESVGAILGAMLNMDGAPSVIKGLQNADGGHNYTVIFPISMKDVPQLGVHLSDIPVLITTVENGNVLGGSFRLGFEGQTTGDIPFDADAAEVQKQLESLSSVGKVSVFRGNANEQNGFSWEVEFLSNENGGDLENLIVHGDFLTTTNPLGHANIEISPGGIDGSYITGFFQLEMKGEMTVNIAANASASAVKMALEGLTTVEEVKVSRTEGSSVGGYTWFVTFLNVGYLPAIIPLSKLAGGSGHSPTIVASEIRKRTVQEVQTIRVLAGGDAVNSSSTFRLSFMGQSTGEIRALPLGGASCLGSTSARQFIISSTEDTSEIGGDDTVSPLTQFKLGFNGYETGKIHANAAPCSDTANKIQLELNNIPPLSEVAVSGGPSGVDDGGCVWIVTFRNVDGNPELLNVTAYHGIQSTGVGKSVTVGPNPSIVRDTLTVFQPLGFEGDVNIIQSELSKLNSVGSVTVTSSDIDFPKQCLYQVTFETKAGNLLAITAFESNVDQVSTNLTLSTGDSIFIEDNTVQGTSSPVSGDFALVFNGHRTAYMAYDVPSKAMALALEELDTVGKVNVARGGPNENDCYFWDITFLTNLGPQLLIVVDDRDLKGTAASASAVKVQSGEPPPFDGPDYQFSTLIDLTRLATVISSLKQGINYFFRARASNEFGSGPAVTAYPPFIKPMPQPPGVPSEVQLAVRDGSTLAVKIHAPVYSVSIGSFRVDYSLNPFANEKQQITLQCAPKAEIQTVTTSAKDFNEVQYIVLDSAFKNHGYIAEKQRVRCCASGGFFGLTFAGKTAYINYDATESAVKAALESLSNIVSVSVAFHNLTEVACKPYDGLEAGEFIVTFVSLVDMAGDVPQMTAQTTSLQGARRVDIDTLQDGDAPLGGLFTLRFRGATTDPIDASLPPESIAPLIENQLESLDTIESHGVKVVAVTLVNGGDEKIFSVEFQGEGVGGNVESIEVVNEQSNLYGTGANIFIKTDGEIYFARNGVDKYSSREGNVITGNFRLKLLGHTTDDIPFNAGSELVKTRLEALPDIGKVNVQVSNSTQVLGFTWTITFLESPGYFPPPSRNVDTLAYDSFLSTTVDNGESVAVHVETIRDGDNPLSGKFSVGYYDGSILKTTPPLHSFISGDELQKELESLSNVGRVFVTRSRHASGYSWDVEFVGCSFKDGLDICNEGNLFPLVVSNVSLQGCGGTMLNVSKLVLGSGPGVCEQSRDRKCRDEELATTDFPITHIIQGLSLGTKYYVQVRLRNDQGWSRQQLSSPSFATPHHSAPGQPPPVVLLKSSATSITVGWEKPKSNGGSKVTGYELWMDKWNGGSSFVVYDGEGQSDEMEYTVTTHDIGPMNQIVESGKQYIFTVRAINNCNIFDPAFACFGPFSNPQIFFVRDPRPPLPPAAPRRDSKTALLSQLESSISVTWSRPVDNGGSPITGYILYMKRSDDTVSSFPVGSNVTEWTVGPLNAGEVIRFHVVAVNLYGRSGNSPFMTTVAAVRPGLNHSLFATYSSEPQYSPKITILNATSMTVEWVAPSINIGGGAPIIGFKLYMYEGVGGNIAVTQEIQEISIDNGGLATGGSFTCLFRGEETSDISAQASSAEVKAALENLSTINVVSVTTTFSGWRITFESEAGDLPLIEVTSGRITAPADVFIGVKEIVKGLPARLVYNGANQPNVNIFIATQLEPDTGYAFKVAPINAIGEGVLSVVSDTATASFTAAALQTTASGSALVTGIAGFIREEQVVVFVSDDCESDQLVLSINDSHRTGNLCGFSALAFEEALEILGKTGDVHVTRNDVTTLSGLQGFAWTITFITLKGDAPTLRVDHSLVNRGRDWSERSGFSANYVTEFMKGKANEFTIEPKKASGLPTTLLDGNQGLDIFFTELWHSDAPSVDDSHRWHSDGGLATFNPIQYEVQILTILAGAPAFRLTMDTSDLLDGVRLTSKMLPGENVTALEIQEALEELLNVGNVEVSASNFSAAKCFRITFTSVFGERPLLESTADLVNISRTSGNFGVAEVQTISLLSDLTILQEVQSISIPRSANNFTLSYRGLKTNIIFCNFTTGSEFLNSATLMKAELDVILDGVVLVDPVVLETGSDSDPWVYTITFVEPAGPFPLLYSDEAIVTEVSRGWSNVQGTFVLSYENHFTSNIPFDASALVMKRSLEALPTINEVEVKKENSRVGFQWTVTFTKQLGNLPDMVAYPQVFGVQTIETVGGDPTPLGGTFTLSYLSENTSPLSFDISANEMKIALEAFSAINRVDVDQVILPNGQMRWAVTFRCPVDPAELKINATLLSGSVFNTTTVRISVSPIPTSLLSISGLAPTIRVKEKVAGLPSYTGRYFSSTSGTYLLAILQLQRGGLQANYYDNMWLKDEVVLKKVDTFINFNWGNGSITPHGRDFVSVRWWGKLKPRTSEIYTFYVLSDDGVRLSIDHVMLIDTWNLVQGDKESRASIALSADNYHDIKLEYKEETGEDRRLGHLISVSSILYNVFM